MRSLGPRCMVTMCVLISFLTAFAQTGGPPPPARPAVAAGSTPPAGDPAVFVMFLNYQAQLLQDVQKMSAENPDSSASLSTSAAASMNLTAADFAEISPVYQQLQLALQPIEADADAYRDTVASGKQAYDLTVMQQLHARRVQAIVNARTQLQKALTPAGWAAINAYIDGPFRKTIVRSIVGK